MHLLRTYVLLTTFQVVYVLDVKLGGLFDSEAKNDSINIREYMFKYALSVVNEELANTDIHFNPEIRNYPLLRNSFIAAKKVCDLMREGIAGLFGPHFGDSVHVVEDICDLKEVPNIQTRWQRRQAVSSGSLNLHPHPDALSEAFLNIIQEWQWTEYTILYENSESLMRINTLLQPDFNKSSKVKLQRLIDEGFSYRPLLRKIKESGDYNIILDCSMEILPDILQQAQQVGLMSSDHSFLITNLDFHTLDLEAYKYSGTNITSFRLFLPTAIEEIVSNFTTFIKRTAEIGQELSTLPLDAVLIYDAVMMYTEAVRNILSKENEAEINYSVPCDSQEAWPYGYSIINSMKLNTFEGLSGLIKFDHRGFRKLFDMHILELTENGFIEVGKWNIEDGVQIYGRPSKNIDADRLNSLRNTTMNVVISLTAPYGMRVKSHRKLYGNDQYEGFCVDLIKELSAMNNNFSINFIISKDAKSGSPKELKNKTVVWDGMIGYILRGEADLACADLTVTRVREEVVDYTAVFMNLGIAILYKKPKSDPPGFFSFLSPFKTEVWMLVVTAYVTVSLSFFIIARISPYEWTNPFPCVQDPEELENQFTLTNSFWFTIGALMQQGSEIAPISVSTRLAAGVWWFFTLIMVACYTANLAAFLTTENASEEFSSIDELAQQTEIKYGAKKGGTTLQFFNESSESLHKQMFNYMMVHADEVLTESTPQGVAKAVNEKYAFLMESSQIEYETERECTLTQIGKPIDDKGYGIAMKKGSWYLGIFSQSILKMQEEGKLSDLKRKWWKEKYAGSCTVTEANDAETLGLMNLGGVFLVLGGGSAVAILVAVLELLFYAWFESRDENTSVRNRLKKELKFFLRCHGTTKPAASESGSGNSAVINYD